MKFPKNPGNDKRDYDILFNYIYNNTKYQFKIFTSKIFLLKEKKFYLKRKILSQNMLSFSLYKQFLNMILSNFQKENELSVAIKKQH